MDDYLNSESYEKAIKDLEIIKNALPKFPEIPKDISAAIEEFSKMFSEIKQSLSASKGFIEENQLLPTIEYLQGFAEIVKAAQKKELELEGLTKEEFENKYKDSIEASKNIGRCGWVISPYTSGEVYKEWGQLIQNGDESSVEEYFYSNNIVTKIFEEFEQKYKTGANGQYYSQAKKYYDLRDYMTSAMYFFALLDNRISELVAFPKRRMPNSKKYSEEGFKEQKVSNFDELSVHKRTLTKIIFFSELYPSLIEYLNRVFYDDIYLFEKKIEPPYLNRNWLMHGKMSRTVKRYEVVQIMNALCVLELLMKKKVIN